MKFWVLATLISFGLGAGIGWASRGAAVPAVPNNVAISEPKSAAAPVVSREAALPATGPSTPRNLPKILIAQGEMVLSPRLQALRLLFDAASELQLQEALIHVVWGDRDMERKALTLFRSLENTQDLDQFVTLKLLECVTDESVRSDLSEWVRSERDPSQRLRLASIVASIFQSREFLPSIETLLADPDPRVPCACLENFWVGRAFIKDLPDVRSRLVGLISSLAGPDRPVSLRVQALRSLRGSDDETTTRFLMQTALREQKSEIVVAALGSLPEAYELSNDALAIEMIRMLYSLAVDETKPRNVRSAAANAADLNDRFGEDKILTAAEQELMEKIRESLWEE